MIAHTRYPIRSIAAFPNQLLSRTTATNLISCLIHYIVRYSLSCDTTLITSTLETPAGSFAQISPLPYLSVSKCYIFNAHKL